MTMNEDEGHRPPPHRRRRSRRLRPPPPPSSPATPTRGSSRRKRMSARFLAGIVASSASLCVAFPSLDVRRYRSRLPVAPDGRHGRGRLRQLERRRKRHGSLRSVASEAEAARSAWDERRARDVDADRKWIVQWRGEGTEGYSEALRELEFTSAFRAELADHLNLIDFDGRFVEDVGFQFQDALTYRGPVYDPSSKEDSRDDGGGGEPIPLAQVATYESAMQYAVPSLPPCVELDTFALDEVFQNTVERCSLVRTAFRVAAAGQSYEELATAALEDGSFDDLMDGGRHANATWSVRLRRYGSPENTAEDVVNNMVGGADGIGDGVGEIKGSKRHARYGKNSRSPLRDERKAILAMADLVKQFRGKVDLTRPECSIYLLEDLRRYQIYRRDVKDAGTSETLLARVIAKGPKTSIYAPKTRICVTTTPLCPIASFALCNAARLPRRGSPAVLDPFAGSCATLLAAAHITSQSTDFGGCRSVAIEIAHNGYVNRDDIVEDFETRSLQPPLEIIRGDCLSNEVRRRARAAIGGDAFDIIVTDPPYGIREAMTSEGDGHHSNDDDCNNVPEISPLAKLFAAMGRDRTNGEPLLRPGGRLVAFVPVRKGESLESCLPDSSAMEEAGLVIEGEGKEQVLSDILSRWLVSFVCK
ncbi:hypothetical protein ACHAWF_008716 [Thalassiosira exigua]